MTHTKAMTSVEDIHTTRNCSKKVVYGRLLKYLDDECVLLEGWVSSLLRIEVKVGHKRIFRKVKL